MAKKSGAVAQGKQAGSYRHSEAESVLRPDVGTQAQWVTEKTQARYVFFGINIPA